LQRQPSSLSLSEGQDAVLSATGREPLARLRHTAWPESAHTDTDYTPVIFPGRILGAEAEVIARADPESRWVTLDETQAGFTGDGRRVSPTVDRILAAL
jgi:hypothetical protein